MQQLTKLPYANWLVLIVVRPYKRQTPLKHFDNFTRKIIRTGKSSEQEMRINKLFADEIHLRGYFRVNFKLMLLFRKVSISLSKTRPTIDVSD